MIGVSSSKSVTSPCGSVMAVLVAAVVVAAIVMVVAIVVTIDIHVMYADQHQVSTSTNMDPNQKLGVYSGSHLCSGKFVMAKLAPLQTNCTEGPGYLHAATRHGMMYDSWTKAMLAYPVVIHTEIHTSPSHPRERDPHAGWRYSSCILPCPAELGIHWRHAACPQGLHWSASGCSSQPRPAAVPSAPHTLINQHTRQREGVGIEKRDGANRAPHKHLQLLKSLG